MLEQLATGQHGVAAELVPVAVVPVLVVVLAAVAGVVVVLKLPSFHWQLWWAGLQWAGPQLRQPRMVPQLGCLFVVEVVAVAVESAVVVAVVAKFAVVVAIVANVGQDRRRLSQPVDRVAAAAPALAERQLPRLQQLRRQRLDARALQARPRQLLAANGPASQPPVI